jgi:hypothetical protein
MSSIRLPPASASNRLSWGASSLPSDQCIRRGTVTCSCFNLLSPAGSSRRSHPRAFVTSQAGLFPLFAGRSEAELDQLVPRPRDITFLPPVTVLLRQEEPRPSSAALAALVSLTFPPSTLPKGNCHSCERVLWNMDVLRNNEEDWRLHKYVTANAEEQRHSLPCFNLLQPQDIHKRQDGLQR